MPINTDFKVPISPQGLTLPQGPDSKTFIAFIASIDAATGESWCPDVRAALPYINKAFSASDGPELALVQVGHRPEWRDSGNLFRAADSWNIRGLPTLVRYEQVDGVVKETGRLLEDEIIDEKQLQELIG